MLQITVGQALLLLIDHHTSDAKLCNELKRIYLTGISSNVQLKQIEKLFINAGFSQNYVISTDPGKINEDASRRYFETHLAHLTLSDSLNQIHIAPLESHCNSLLVNLPTEKQQQFNEYISGKRSPKEDRFAEEYLDAIAKIQSHEKYSQLSQSQKNKLILLMKCAWLAVMHGKSPMLPFNIYGTGLFSEAARGKVAKQDGGKSASKYAEKNFPYHSKHFGLMKHYMFVPKNDIAYADTGFGFIKPSDTNNVNYDAEWSVKNFSTLVHPFSCGISGTMLIQLNFMKFLQLNNNLKFKDHNDFCQFLKCFMSGLLFNSGGHSYNEFFAVLKIPEIIKAFEFMPNFKDINMESLLINGNERAFHAAINDAVEYNKVILAHQAFHQKLMSK